MLAVNNNDILMAKLHGLWLLSSCNTDAKYIHYFVHISQDEMNNMQKQVKLKTIFNH